MIPEQFQSYIQRLGLPASGVAYINAAKNPSRQVENSWSNLIIRYPSVKAGKVIPLESRRIEFALALILENDATVLVYWSQPPEVSVDVNGSGVKLKPTFLVLRTSGVELVQVHSADRMATLGKAYTQVGNTWESPLYNTAAKSLGFTYRIWTDAECTRELIRNLKFLDSFLKLGEGKYSSSVWEPVLQYVKDHPGISLEELSTASGVEGAALVRWMLAYKHLYCNLDTCILAEPKTAYIYPNSAVAKAVTAMQITPQKWSELQSLGKVDELTKVLLRSDKSLLDQAYRRWQILQGLLPKEQWDTTDRAVRRWRKAYSERGFLGLLSARYRQGNREEKLDARVVKLADQFIDQYFCAVPKKKASSVFIMFKSACQAVSLPSPSHVWFYKRIKRLAMKDVVQSQEGNRAAYAYQYNTHSIDGLWDSRGDYPFMDVHCDHTQLSIFLSSEKTGQVLGKPWLTILFDATCRAVLALYLSFDSPSRDSIMMVLRDCVLRHKRLPFGLVIDNGAEFRSTYFEVLTATKGIMLTRRPPHEPKYGNPVENYFGVAESQLIQVLEGSSLILKTPRKASKSVDPRNHAVWTLSELFDALEFYCFEIFNKRPHADLGKSPADAMKEKLEQHGVAQFPEVAFDNDFLIQTMPEAPFGTSRVLKPNTIKLRGDLFQNPQLAGHLGKNLPVRWDPMDPSRILVQLPEGWVECKSKYLRDVQGLSVRNVKFFAQELRQRHASTAKERMKSDVVFGEFLRDLKDKKEPGMQVRAQKAAESTALNKHLTTVSTPPVKPVPVQDLPVTEELPIRKKKTVTL